MKPRLVVIGSANRDLVVKTNRIPAPGETVIGGAFVTAAGGKGANQAVAAARLGAEVWFVGRVGQDGFGDSLANDMAADGINVDYLLRDPFEPTGVALIGVDAQGENAIIVASGANGQVSRADVEAARSVIANAYAVVLQLEIPLDTVQAAVDAARSSSVKVILNPAPVNRDRPLTNELLAKIDVLTPNEHEAAILLGHSSPVGMDWDQAALQLRDKGVGTVVITLGDQGCVVADAGGSRRILAFPVDPVDTTAAGDCFTGALALSLAEGHAIDHAAHFACLAAAISVTQMGAQPSLPSREQVDRSRI